MKVVQINNSINISKRPVFKGVHGPKNTIEVIKNRFNSTPADRATNSFTRLVQSAEVLIKKGKKTDFSIELPGVNPKKVAWGVGLLASSFGALALTFLGNPLWYIATLPCGSVGLAILLDSVNGRSVADHNIDLQVGQGINKKKNLTGIVTEPIKTTTSGAYYEFDELEKLYQDNLFKDDTQSEVIDYLTKTFPEDGKFVNLLSKDIVTNLFKLREQDADEIFSTVLDVKNPNGESYFEIIDSNYYRMILDSIKDVNAKKQFLLKFNPEKNSTVAGILYNSNNLNFGDINLIKEEFEKIKQVSNENKEKELQDYIKQQFIKDEEGSIPLHDYIHYAEIDKKLSAYPEILAKLYLIENNNGLLPIETRIQAPQVYLTLNKCLESCPKELLEIYFHNFQNNTKFPIIYQALRMDSVMDDLIDKIKVSPKLMLEFKDKLNKILEADNCGERIKLPIKAALNKIDSEIYGGIKDADNINFYEIKNLIEFLERPAIKESKGELLSITYNENGDNLLCAIADILPKNENPTEYQKLLDVIQEAPLANYNITDSLGFSFIEKILHSENQQLFDVVKKHRFNYTPTLHETFDRIINPEFKEKVRKELKVSFPDVIQAITTESKKALEEQTFVEQINSPFFTEEIKKEVWDKLVNTKLDFGVIFTRKFGHIFVEKR